MDKVTIELNIEDAKLIKEWVGVQDFDDTVGIIENYHLGIDAYKTDNALYRLCKKLGERC